jgi:hypothetical protein
MARRTQLAPHHGVNWDGLCGIFALVNGIRLATDDHTDAFDYDIWRELLLTLLAEAEDLVGTATAVCARHRHKAAVRAR